MQHGTCTVLVLYRKIIETSTKRWTKRWRTTYPLGWHRLSSSVRFNPNAPILRANNGLNRSVSIAGDDEEFWFPILLLLVSVLWVDSSFTVSTVLVLYSTCAYCFLSMDSEKLFGEVCERSFFSLDAAPLLRVWTLWFSKSEMSQASWNL